MITTVYNTLVIGTGAAGYAAACRLAQVGVSVAIVTEGIQYGTSRNTGSDKQTYYKLGLGSSTPDSVRNMAADLFAPGAVDGDNALCEAACSARAFSYLCELGVPFPRTEYSEYIGYKTDHDPCARATSTGPLTSKHMVEALQRRARELDIPVLDSLYVTRVLTDENGVVGIVCLNRSTGRVETLPCAHLILATGGPAGIYADSVYPVSQNGASSLAPMAGAAMQNLTEWQYGLASVHPRWNVSGTYMQVLPRVISVNGAGTEREFLLDLFAGDAYAALSALFLKGYQWPFDSRRAVDGSSVIDLAVYRERVLFGRRVYLDFQSNPFGLKEIDFDRLSEEARAYLAANGACFGTPLARLAHMNQPAIDLYLSKGMDITQKPLEIALCAQHCNGGVAVDADWQTAVRGLYAVGEVAGTHGIARPGGSALNAGQVGAMRAAAHIARSTRAVGDPGKCTTQLAEELNLCRALVNTDQAKCAREELRRAMSACAAPIRNTQEIAALLADTAQMLSVIHTLDGTPEERFRLRDTLITVRCVLTAMLDYAKTVGVSRGSAIYTDRDGACRDGMEEIFRHKSANNAAKSKIQEIRLNGTDAIPSWRPVRPIPEEETAFEVIWRKFREKEGLV